MLIFRNTMKQHTWKLKTSNPQLKFSKGLKKEKINGFQFDCKSFT